MKILIPKNEKKEIKVLVEDNNYNITLDENAELELMMVFDSEKDSKININVNLKENAKLNLINLQKFSQTTNNNIEREVKLEKNSIFNLFDLNFGNMLIKGALSDNSKTFYKGLIKINKNAGNSNGYQKQESILLSENAESNSVPKLEINNNDVRCTHGSSVSQLDDNLLFYVMSRGLNEKDAKVTLVRSFLQEVVNKVNFGEIDSLIKEKIK